MLESVVSTLLNRVLGAYVSNLNYNQLKIGIWSGIIGEAFITEICCLNDPYRRG